METRIDVYETLCPQQMLVHKGGKIKNWGGECRDVTPTKLQSQVGGGEVRVCERRIEFFVKIPKKNLGGGGGGGGGQGGCERRIKVFVKIQKKNLFFFGGRGGGRGGGEGRIRGGRSGWWGGGVRVDVNQELKFCENLLGGWGRGGGGGGGGVRWGVRVGGVGGLGWM